MVYLWVLSKQVLIFAMLLSATNTLAETYRNNRKNKNVNVDIRDIREISPKEVINKLGIKRGT